MESLEESLIKVHNWQNSNSVRENEILPSFPSFPLDNNVKDSNFSLSNCTSFEGNYDPTTSLLLVSLFFLSALFLFFGYRCYKVILFITGFSFSLIVVFLICQEEALLPQYGNIGISALTGLLYGLICLLVPYVGFFTLGFHGGIILGIFSMIFFPATYSIWISIIFLLGAGLFGAICNVCFPALTPLSSSLMGGVGVSLAIDYFVEKLVVSFWVWAHVSGKQDGSALCWFSWALLALCPILVIIGTIVQYLTTPKELRIQSYPYKKEEVGRRRLTREERALAREAKYRYLYQVRTAGGDILSQSYVQSLQNNSQLDTLSTHMSTLQPHHEEGRAMHDEDEEN